MSEESYEQRALQALDAESSAAIIFAILAVHDVLGEIRDDLKELLPLVERAVTPVVEVVEVEDMRSRRGDLSEGQYVRDGLPRSVMLLPFKIAIHVRADSPKSPQARFSVYLQRHRVGVSWRNRRGGAGMLMRTSNNGVERWFKSWG